MAIDPVRIDHVTAALARLPAYLADKQRWRELLAALVRPLQEAEDALLDILSQRHLDNAVGAQLDQLGALVKEPRGGREDDAYRRRIRARIAHNRSQGLTEDLIRIAKLVVYDDAATIACEQHDVATEVIRVEDAAVTDDVAADLVAFERTAVSAGVRVLVEYSSAAPEATFAFEGGGTGLGFPSPYTMSLANKLAGGAGYDTVIGVRPAVSEFATAITLAFDDTGSGAGALSDVWPDILFEFEVGVTTMADFEAAIDGSSWFYVVTSSTAPFVLLGDVAADTFGPAPITEDSTYAPGGAFAGALE